jgi:DNA-directed RNA polymerase subunit RPC12/RpoP
MLYAGSRVMGGKRVKSYLSTCPYCGHDSEFAEEPETDYICEECGRRVPIQDGKVLDVTGVRCGFCGSLNFMSEKTKVLICEECDREIPLLDPNTGEMRHVAKGYARVDDTAMYDLVLVKVPRDKEPLINSLQHMLSMTRIQVKDLLDDLPATLIQGVNRRKGEMLRAQIEANDGETEFRVSEQKPAG